MEDGLYTHINTDGKLLHGRTFVDLDIFHKGYARARDAQGWHHIDCEGRPLYLRRFAEAEPFYNGLARVEDESGDLLIIDELGDTKFILRRSLELRVHPRRQAP